MEDHALPAGIPLPAISHIAFVVDDLEDGMERFRRLLGITPWLIYEYEPPRLTETTYRGEPHDYSMRVAISDVTGPIDLLTKVVPPRALKHVLGWIASVRDRLLDTVHRYLPRLPDPDLTFPAIGVPGVNVELIEPIQGPSTYTEFRDADGHGIHHIGCFEYNAPRKVVETYAEAGVPIIQSGRFDGLEFWYLDLTNALNGVILEIAADLWAIPEPDATYPA